MITIQILGMGCTRCRKTEENAQKAIKSLGVDATLERIDDIDTLLKYDITATPAVVINGEIVSNDRVMEYDEFIKLLTEKDEMVLYSNNSI